jgi:hypothetical protein
MTSYMNRGFRLAALLVTTFTIAFGGLVTATPAFASYGANPNPYYSNGACSSRYDSNCLVEQSNYYNAHQTPLYNYNYNQYGYGQNYRYTPTYSAYQTPVYNYNTYSYQYQYGYETAPTTYYDDSNYGDTYNYSDNSDYCNSSYEDCSYNY